ncbi:MAG: hypothetical protein ABUL60_20845 [Myxococcales bacterium]
MTAGDEDAMSGAPGGSAQASAGSGGTGAAVEDEPSPAGAAGQGGTAGQAGTAGAEPIVDGTPCATSDDCDDGKPCDGQEACVSGFCAAGEAPSCDPNLQCSDNEGGACVFADESPWIVYQADDDTPGVPEVYAVKRGLLGKMTPIKLNDPLDAGWETIGGTWSPDHQLYTFIVRQRSPYQATMQTVRFGRGLPEKAVTIPGDSMDWAPSGRAFAMSEASGISIYEYATDGTFKRAFTSTDPDNEDGYGDWTPLDELVFISTSKLTQKSSIRLAKLEGTTWKASELATGIADLWRFDVSPTGTEFIYQAQHSDSYGPMYVMGVHSGGAPKPLAPAGYHPFSWSRDGSKFLLLEEDDAGYTKAYLGTGSAYSRQMTQIAPGEIISSAWFTPDSKQVILWEPANEWAHDVTLLDPAKNTAYSYDTLARNGLRDSGPFFSQDQDLAVIPERDYNNTEIHLLLFSLSGRHSRDRFDSIPPDNEYRDVRISAHNEFVAYTKGVYPNYDGAYVDLRYNTSGDPKPVRLPGEGTLYSFNFDSSGTALYYIRELDNGARDCYYLDLSRQVAQAPIKVNRDGRTNQCSAQPLTP